MPSYPPSCPPHSPSPRYVSVSFVFRIRTDPAPQSNPLIPTGISTSCTNYLTTFDGDASFTSCTNIYTTALASFAPSANTSLPSSSAVATALDTLCAANATSPCPQSTLTTQLSAFYAACSAELTSAPNPSVKLLYDVLYVLQPLRQSVCSKDDNGNFCATELTNSSSTGTVALVDPEASQKQAQLDSYLYSTSSTTGAAARRDLSNSTTILIPNATTFEDTNLVFLFLNPSNPSCTTCTRNILTSYISFESTCPYAPGINSSLLLAGQSALYNNITNTCGANFLSGAVQAAGGISSGLVSGAAPRAGAQELSAAVSAILGVVAFVAASV